MYIKPKVTVITVLDQVNQHIHPEGSTHFKTLSFLDHVEELKQKMERSQNKTII